MLHGSTLSCSSSTEQFARWFYDAATNTCDDTSFPTPERRHMDDQLVPVTQVSEGAVLTQDDLDNFMLVSALGVSETRDDGRVIYEVPEELAGYGLPAGLSGGGLQEFLHGLPRLPEPLGLPDLPGRMAPDDVPAPEPVRDQQQPAAAPKALSPMRNGPPGDDPPRPDVPPCEHLRTTRSGTNAHYNMLRCLDCGRVLQRERCTATTTATPKAAGHVGSVSNPGLVDCQTPLSHMGWHQRFPLATNLPSLR